LYWIWTAFLLWSIRILWLFFARRDLVPLKILLSIARYQLFRLKFQVKQNPMVDGKEVLTESSSQRSVCLFNQQIRQWWSDGIAKAEISVPRKNSSYFYCRGEESQVEIFHFELFFRLTVSDLKRKVFSSSDLITEWGDLVESALNRNHLKTINWGHLQTLNGKSIFVAPIKDTLLSCATKNERKRLPPPLNWQRFYLKESIFLLEIKLRYYDESEIFNLFSFNFFPFGSSFPG